jgi:hypothetical protein
MGVNSFMPLRGQIRGAVSSLQKQLLSRTLLDRHESMAGSANRRQRAAVRHSVSPKLSDQFCVARFSTLGNFQEGVQLEDRPAGIALCGQSICDFPNSLYRQLNDTPQVGIRKPTIQRRGVEVGRQRDESIDRAYPDPAHLALNETQSLLRFGSGKARQKLGLLGLLALDVS